MRLVYCCFFYFIFSTSFCQEYFEEQRVVVRNLGDDFFTIEKATQKSTPLFSDEKSKKSYLIFNSESYKDFDLTFAATKDMFLFVNNKLIYKSSVSGIVSLPISLLRQISKQEALLTFYSPIAPLNHNEIVVSKKSKFGTIDNKKVLDRIPSRNGDAAIFLILILAVLGLIKNKDTILWKGYFNPSSVFASRSQTDEYVLRSVFSTESLMLITLLSLTITCLLNELSLVVIEFQSVFLPVVLVNFIMVFLLLLFKYVFLKTVSTFLNITSFGIQQFYDFLRYVIWLSFLMLVLILGFKQEFDSFSKLVLWGGITLWNIKILSAALTKVRFQKLYLFSYICASELMPAIVLINFIETIN